MKYLTGLPYDPETTFFERGDDGLIRLYDMMSGETLQVLGPMDYISRLPVEFSEITREDGTKIMVQKNVAIDEKVTGMNSPTYSPVASAIICQDIVNGKALKTVLEEQGLKHSTITIWKSKHPEFKDALEAAYADRADYLADRALEEAETANETVAGVAKGKLIVDTLRWSAEVANRKKFGNSVKVDGNINTAVQIIIETGVRRSTDKEFIVDETKKIQDAIESKRNSGE
jgi:hypothetical protein